MDRTTFEAIMRDALGGHRPPPDAHPGAFVQERGLEPVIAFCMFVFDEKGRGTEPNALLDGGARLIGSMVENLALAFSETPERAVVARILSIAEWQTRDDYDDRVVVVSDRVN